MTKNTDDSKQMETNEVQRLTQELMYAEKPYACILLVLTTFISLLVLLQDMCVDLSVL